MIDTTPPPTVGVGLGYRTPLHRDILRHLGEIDFLEVVSDNFFANEPALRALASLRPCIPHSLGASIGSRVEDAYLERMRRVIEVAHPPWYSDHLAFTQAGEVAVGHLAPVPYTEESLERVVTNIRRVQETIGGRFALENITMPFYWPDNTMSEGAFLREVVRRTGCFLLLDLENVRINHANHGREGRDLLDSLPLERVAQVHVAGGVHGVEHAHDTHNAPVSEATWGLLQHLVDVCPPRNVLLERDSAFPPFAETLGELRRARSILAGA